MTTYLMLDKDDITKVCGTITRKEFLEETGFSQSKASSFIMYGRVFRDKYILVEDYHEEVSENISVLVAETLSMKRYYATQDGKIYVVYKNGKVKYLSGYLKKSRNQNNWCVKLSDKDYVAKNLIASLFIKEYKPGDVVILKNDRNPRNVNVDNLIVIDKAIYAKMTGPMSRSKKVGLFENGKMIRTFRSAREAGRKMYCSYQMVSDCCNNVYKTKEYDFRWI